MACTTPPIVRAWYVCIAGYTQRRGQPTGTHKLWLRLGNELRDWQTQVEFCCWNDRFSDLAETIKVSRNGARPLVYVFAYSWGAGWGFTQLARELRKRSLRINGAVLCDPVYRSRWLTFQWRSIFGHPRIVVPPNVRNVAWLRQHTNKPCGHELVAADPTRTTIAPAIVLDGVEHSSMDESDEFLKLSLGMAGISRQ